MSLFTDSLKGGGFGGFQWDEPRLVGVDAAVIPVPYDLTVSYAAGTRNGPRAIIDASSQVELYDAAWDINYEDLNLALPNEVEQVITGPGDMVDRVEEVYRAVYEKAPFILTLGGEHSITTAPVRVLSEKYGDTLTVVQFDAHSDLRDSYQGSPFSHASVMRRVVDLAPITQIGIRNVSKPEMDFIRANGHPVYYSWDVAGKTDWIDGMVDDLKENVYITFDLDGFDPSVVPGVGTPEPGGLYWRETVEAIKRIGEKRNIVGADVMELKPIPGSVVSEFSAARLCFKLLGAALMLGK